MKKCLVFTALLFSLKVGAQTTFNNATEGTAVPILKLTSGTGGVSNSGGSIEFYKSTVNPMGRIYTGNIYSNGIADSKGKLILSSYYNAFKDELVLYNGYVGINTFTPAAPLDVNGNVIIGNGTTGSNVALTIKGPNSPTNAASFQDISYSFTSAGSARIRAYRGGNWDTYIQFLTNSYSAGGDVPIVRMHVDGNGNVGIGTTTPSTKLEVQVDGNLGSTAGNYKPLSRITGNEAGYKILMNDFLYREVAGNDWTTASYVRGVSVDNSFLVPGVSLRSWIKQKAEGHKIEFGSLGTTYMSIVEGNVGIGTTSPTERLAVNGNIRTKKIIVTQTGWPDYVFQPTYQLLSLSSLEEYINHYKHLPDVPSAEEIETNGNDLGATQAVLLKKIEELTLYVIELQKQIDNLKKD